jgi:hypothetical protein
METAKGSGSGRSITMTNAITMPSLIDGARISVASSPWTMGPPPLAWRCPTSPRKWWSLSVDQPGNQRGAARWRYRLRHGDAVIPSACPPRPTGWTRPRARSEYLALGQIRGPADLWLTRQALTAGILDRLRLPGQKWGHRSAQKVQLYAHKLHGAEEVVFIMRHIL